jgi:hypothetical protein
MRDFRICILSIIWPTSLANAVISEEMSRWKILKLVVKFLNGGAAIDVAGLSKGCGIKPYRHLLSCFCADRFEIHFDGPTLAPAVG